MTTEKNSDLNGNSGEVDFIIQCNKCMCISTPDNDKCPNCGEIFKPPSMADRITALEKEVADLKLQLKSQPEEMFKAVIKSFKEVQSSSFISLKVLEVEK